MKNVHIRFSQHALEKFDILRRHGLTVDREIVENIVRHPAKVDTGHQGRKILQGELDSDRVLRIVIAERPDELLIITVYPGKKVRYE